MTQSYADVEDVLNIPVVSDVSICRDLLEPSAVTMVVSSPGLGIFPGHESRRECRMADLLGPGLHCHAGDDVR